jgi:hypothetical protein
MIDNESLNFEVKVTTTDSLVTLKMDTEYGPVTFSYHPDEVEKGLSKLVTNLLDKLQTEKSEEVKSLAQNIGTPLDEVKKNLDAYNAQVNEVPSDALGQLLHGNRPYVQGTVEQFMDNLPLSITLMLSHQAAAAVIRTTIDLDERRKANLNKSEDELFEFIYRHFKQAISQLWDRPEREQKRN